VHRVSGSDNAFAGLRSLLFVPMDDAGRARRAFDRGADAVVLDLEDGVAPGAKDDARAALCDLLREGRRGGSAVLVRVNALDSAWGRDDLGALRDLPVDGIVVPKATPEAVRSWAELAVPLLALVETAAGLRSAHATASDPAVHALMLGAADLGAELGLAPRPDGLELLHARSTLVVDSAAAGVRAPFDAVCLAVRETDTLVAETELAKSLGFGGKACIHPAQVAPVNSVFSPTSDELAEAREVVGAYEAAVRDGRGALTVRGQMIDLPVVARARATLAKGELVGATGEEDR
jgi:citrate lyase beta subunit